MTHHNAWSTSSSKKKDRLFSLFSGIFHKKDSPEELHRSIREVAAGKILIDQHYLRQLVKSVAIPGLTPTRLTDCDRDVLRLEGASHKETAASLKISKSATKASLQQLFTKTGVQTRGQLVRFALEHCGDDTYRSRIRAFTFGNNASASD